MAKYEVTYEDKRSIEVYADNEDAAKHQARHQETTRIEMEMIRKVPNRAPVSSPVSVIKIKD
jgi:hypothetical protein